MELPNKTVSKLHHFQARPRAVVPNFGFGVRNFAHHREENESTSKHHNQIESSCLVLMALSIFHHYFKNRTRCFQKFRIEENAAAHRQRDAFVMSRFGF